MTAAAPARPRFGLLYEPSAYGFSKKIMGRQSAGAGLLRAIANARPDEIWCAARSRPMAKDFAEQLWAQGARSTNVHYVPLTEPARLGAAGVLYRPDPGAATHAWHRARRGLAGGYSVVGITHTLCTHNAMSAIAAIPSSPLQDWDALICTTTAARAVVDRLIAGAVEHLREALGATRFARPQLPVIPIGIHTGDFAFGPQARAAARTALGLSPSDVAFLFVGRLIFHGKAHPLPMYLALEEAAREAATRGVRLALLLTGVAPNAAVAETFRREAALFAPSVRTIVVDGADKAERDRAWAAADAFTSLVDSIQESQGLTPIEAMSAGLPVVISDWDGYRDLITDGREGYLIPTLTLPAGSGHDLAERYDLTVDDYDHYAGYASQLVSVDIGATARAYARLALDQGLRRTLGEAGRSRARAVFDWATVWRRYEDLFLELAARRAAAGATASGPSRSRTDRDDPFTTFASFPSGVLQRGTRFQLRPGITPDEAIARRDLGSTRFGHPVQPTPEEITALLRAFAPGEPLSADALRTALPAHPIGRLARGLVWLSKVGVLEVAP